jgi:hypothetical protein
MPFQKGQPRPSRAGRRKGQPNKFSGALKDMILQALSNVGGVDYLEKQAGANPTAFMTLVGRVLPMQVKEGGEDPQVPATVNHHHHDK